MSAITPLSIINNQNETIFSQERYIIPLYQRAFAWTDNEICQLIDDIYDFDAEHYYLGSLIVNVNPDGLYEVIDGQQRLTALFLLLNYLAYSWDDDRLCYECRDRSNYTLNNLAKLADEGNIEAQFANADRIEQSLISGRKIIANKFLSDKLDKAEFIVRLKKLLLFRIEVPNHTDLNRYFEIMNVRGEQLEQHDILKARLMEPLDKAQRNAFAVVWDACRDMTGYVQMHFSTKNGCREALFCEHWNRLNFNNIFNMPSNNGDEQAQTMLQIIGGNAPPEVDDGEDEFGNRIRFDSIIDFPYFVLHVLKVFVNEDPNNMTIPLDDKKLVQTFDTEIKKAGDPKQFSLEFIKCLLKCRFLFDKFFIKREYKNNSSDGEWSLKELKENSKKPQYYNTEFKDWKAREITFAKYKKIRHSHTLMLQACLRVSYTSPKVMHWITRLLMWLYTDENLLRPSNFEYEIESIAKEQARSYIEAGKYYLGVGTPHIILNYLDYLLWKQSNADFTFEYRNSVEHWYPQHPSDGSFYKWEEKTPEGDYLRDFIGNICIISREVNSKFSNLAPTSKKGYEDMIKKGSLKLKKMSEITYDNTAWRTTDCEKHGEEMLNLLRAACNLN